MPKVLGTPTPRFHLHAPSKKESVLIMAFRWHNEATATNYRLRYFVGLRVLVKDWDLAKQRVKFAKLESYTDQAGQYDHINKRLDALSEKTVAIWRDHKGIMTPEDLALELDYFAGKKIRPDTGRTATFQDFLTAYVLERKNAAAAKRGTWKILHTWSSHLNAYATDRGITLDFDSFTWEFLNDFKNWLCAPPRSHGQNYISKGIDVVKQFLREAERRHLHTNTTYRGFSVAKEKTTKSGLSFDELGALYNLDLTNNKRLEKVRDLFLIGCYTGLRYSDFTRIRPEHITEEDGQKFLSITTQKTGTLVDIPLFPQAELLLRKYDFHPPGISNVKMNEYLREVGQLAGLDDTFLIVRTVGGKRQETLHSKWEVLTSHVARRSFATNFFLLGIPAAMLMKITGHATERQFMAYIAVDGKRNARLLAKEVAFRMEQRTLRIVK